jgi:peptidoglycan/xylan/chitin deacetylase (PgdA/CDA1 family)
MIVIFNLTNKSDKQMKRRNNMNLLSAILFCIISILTFGQKQISITIDDPTTKETPKLTYLERDSMILKALDLHEIKAALFVCGMRVDNSNGRLLLNNWDSKNHLICNHSYSHLYYNSKSLTGEAFAADFKKGDSIIRNYKNYNQLFRFPFLKEGNTVEKRDSMRFLMKNEGYKNGYVTIDASDWFIDAQLTAALQKDINTDLTPYKEFYIKHILERANYYDSLAHLVFKRDIKHTLLIHHSLLNALFLNDLLNALRINGWELINTKDAFKDEVFQLQPNIVPCGESIIWQCAKQIDWISKNLRYPAEDEEYEKEPLETYLDQYKKNESEIDSRQQ